MGDCGRTTCDCERMPPGHTYTLTPTPCPPDGRIFLHAEYLQPHQLSIKSNIRHGLWRVIGSLIRYAAHQTWRRR